MTDLEIRGRGGPASLAGNGSRMMLRRLLIVALGVALTAGTAPGRPTEGQERGRRLAKAYCGECHSLADGPSPQRDAPPFARLYQRFPRGGGLGDLLSEGQIAPAIPQEEGPPRRHPRMPQVRLDEDQVSDLMAFLEAIQAPESRRP